VSTHRNDHRFSTYVRKNFDFLISEYGFQSHPKALGYIKNELEIEFYHGKGEIEIVLFVRRDDETFKPYISRLFDLLDIVNRLVPGKMEYPDHLPDYFTEMSDVDEFLKFCADQTKSHCSNILEGDLSVLESIHMKRRSNA
jgi:hypothetical protein